MTSQHFQNEADGWGDWGDWNSNNNANNANNDTRNNNIAPALDPQQAPSTMNHNYNYSNQQASQHLFMNQDLSVRPPQFASPTNAPIYSPFGYEAQSVPAAISQPIDYLNHEFVNSNYYQPAQNLQPVFSPVSQHANHISNQLPVHTPIFEKVSPVVLQDDFKPKHAFQPHRTSSPYQLPPEDFGRTVRPPMESFQPGTSNSPPPPPPASSDDLANTNYLSGQNLNLQNNLPPPPPASIFETINKQSEPNRNLENQQFFEVKQTNHNIFWPSKDGQQRVDLSNLEHPETSQPTVPPTPFTDNVENITMNVILEEQKFAEATKMTTPIQSSYSKNLMQTANTLIGNQENRTDNIENMEFNPRPLFSSVQKQHARVTSYVPTPLFGNTNSENIYPENREQLDDNAPINSSDRHNYLVTGQLSQDMNTAGKIQLSMQQQTSPITVQNEVLPPPGLARLVVGQTESNLEQLLAPPPGLNRMVLGTEVDRDDYMSSQRQADGESQPIPPVTAFNPLLQPQNQSYASNIFNIADRNQYLAAGGGNSNINSQRVIPGVESENSLPLITPMQQLSLDLQDDAEMFTGSSNIGGVNFDERNINADGENIDDDQPQVTPQTTREEAIEGANDDSGGARQQPKKTYSTDDSVKNDTNRSEKIRKDRKLKDRRYKDEDYVASNDSDSDKNDNGKRKDGRYKRGNPEEQDSDHYNYKRDKYARDKERDKYGSRHRRSKDEKETFESDGSKFDTEHSEREKNSDRKYRRAKPKSRNSDGDSRDRNTEKFHKNNQYRSRDEKERSDKEKYRREKNRPPKDRSDRKRGDYFDEDRERYNRRYEHEEENYRTRSRNALDRDYSRRSKDRETHGERKQDPNQAYYGTAQGYGYDSNYYYSQQQQYFETLRRTNPQAYSEYCRNYYAMMQAHIQRDVVSNTEDIAGSTHSGYSSNNEKDRLSNQQRYLAGSVHSSLQTSYIDQSDYAGHYQSHANQQEINKTFHSIADQIAGLNDSHYARKSSLSTSALVSGREEQQHRLTPHKFNCAHGLVKLSNGIVASVDTSGANYHIRLENMVVNDHTRRIFQTYPGPLVRGATNKKSLIEFCEEQLKSNSFSMFNSLWKPNILSVNSDSLKHANRASYALLWNYLILLIRQNGQYSEADISELLMKNVDEFENTADEKKTIPESPEILSKASGTVIDENSDHENETSSEEILASNTISTKSQLTEDGSVKLSEEDVLHKFRDYLLYGNINDALEFATDHNLWGHALFLASKVDRRQHANVMLKFANKLRYNDPLQTLYQIMSGRMPASVTTNLDDKLGDWRPHLAMIISNCTDNPELVKRSIVSLGDSLAGRGDVFGSQFCYLLVDPKFSEYNELANSSNSVNSGKIALVGASHKHQFKDFASNEAIIITEIYEYARSLNNEKFVLPEFQKYKFILANNILDQGMQLKCLLYLEQIAQLINQMPNAFNLNFISKIYSLADKLKFYDPVMEKWYEDNYNNNGASPQNVENQKWLQDLGQVLYETKLRDEYNAGYNEQVPTQSDYYPDYPSVQEMADQQPPLVTMPTQPVQPMTTDSVVHSELTEQAGFYSPQQPIDNYNAPPFGYQPDNSNFEYHNPVLDANQQLPAVTTYSQYQDQHVPNEPIHQIQYQQEQAHQPEFDYWSNQPAPTITLGNAMSNKTDNSATDSSNKIGNVAATKKTADQKNKPAKEKTTLDGAGAANNSGWFGGIWNKITLKPKNQMILPDDKNPSISWDDKQKKWVNKDEDETEAEAFKPPPKMSGMHVQQQMPQMTHARVAESPQFQPENPQNGPMTPNRLMSMQQMQSKPLGASSLAITKPDSQQNMFKMQKGRNLKKSYVDILSNSGQTVSQEPVVMASPIENYTSPQQLEGTPQVFQFYNPNDFQQ